MQTAAQIQAIVNQATADVTAAQGAEASALLLLQQYNAAMKTAVAELAANNVDVSGLSAVLAGFETSFAALAAGVAANPIPGP